MGVQISALPPEWQYPAPSLQTAGPALSFDIDRLRERFPTLARKTYLNSGSYGLLAVDVRRAFEAYLDNRDERGSDWPGWMVQHEALRARVAKLLNAGEDEDRDHRVRLRRHQRDRERASTSSGPRNKVVASDFEFPTSGQIWHAQEQRVACRWCTFPEDAEGTSRSRISRRPSTSRRASSPSRMSAFATARSSMSPAS